MLIEPTKSSISLFDWDGTLRTGYMIVDWVSFLVSHKIVKEMHLQNLLDLKMQLASADITYNQAVWKSTQLYGKAVKNIPVRLLQELSKEFVANDMQRLRPFVWQLFDFLRHCNVEVCIITGAPSIPMVEYGKSLGVSKIFATSLYIKNGKFGSLVDQFWGSKNKKAQLVNQISLKYKIILSIGDTVADMPMLRLAKYGLMINQDKIELVRSTFASEKNLETDIFWARMKEIIYSSE